MCTDPSPYGATRSPFPVTATSELRVVVWTVLRWGRISSISSTLWAMARPARGGGDYGVMLMVPYSDNSEHSSGKRVAVDTAYGIRYRKRYTCEESEPNVEKASSPAPPPRTARGGTHTASHPHNSQGTARTYPLQSPHTQHYSVAYYVGGRCRWGAD